MSKTEQLDSFRQPKALARKFRDFAYRQGKQAGDPERTKDAYVRSVGTWAGTRRPEVMYPGKKLWGMVVYEDNDRFLFDLRVAKGPHAPTILRSSYWWKSELGGLIIAHESETSSQSDKLHYDAGGNRELPGNPQSISRLLERPPFERGLLRENDQERYSIVGRDEINALSRFLIGRTL